MLPLPGFRRRQSDPNGVDTVNSSRGGSPSAPPFDATTLATLVRRAEAAADMLRGLDAAVDRAAKVGKLEEELDSAEQLATRLAAIESQASRLEDVQKQALDAATRAGEEAAQVRTAIAQVARKVDDALSLRDDLDRLPALQGQLDGMRDQASGMTATLRELSEQVGRLRTVHDDALRAHSHASSRLDGVDQRVLATTSKMDSIEQRAVTAEQALDAVLRLASGIPELQHQLVVLKATSEQVTQKVAALAQRRDEVERIASQASRVVGLGEQVESAMRRQEEHARAVSAMEAKLAELGGMHTDLLARGETIAAGQRTLDEAATGASRTLGELRQTMRESVERFEVENRTLSAVSERIAELRSGLKECETRLGRLDDASRTIGETEMRARTLAGQVDTIGGDVTRIAAQAEKLRAVRDDVGELEEALAEIKVNMAPVAELRPVAEAVARDLAKLNGAQEAVRDGTERVRIAHEELTRLRTRQAETDAWLIEADERMRALRGDVTTLDKLRPSVDGMRRDLDQIRVSMDALEQRGAMVDELHRRIGELEGSTDRLRERSEAVHSRVDAAEARFTTLTAHAEEAERVASSMTEVSQGVADAERRMRAVEAVVTTAEDQGRHVEELGERIRLLGQELEQRQTALEAATEQLARASDLRRQAAEAAQELEAIARRVEGGLDQAASRVQSIDGLARDLEGRAAALGDVTQRMGQLESLLERWERAQTEAARALEQAMSRQATVDALQAQIAHVCDLAERAAEDVRSVTAARREVEEARGALDETRAEVASAVESMRDFGERRRQVEALERRLARAEALSRDVRSTIEAIAGQRVIVDQVLERSGALALQVQQAELMRDALRAQCETATRLRSVVETLRDDEDGDDA